MAAASVRWCSLPLSSYHRAAAVSAFIGDFDEKVPWKFATVRQAGRATITGVRAAWTTAVLTEPSNIPVKPPRPRLPTTTN